VNDERPVVIVIEHESSELVSLTSRLKSVAFRVVTCPVEAVGLEYVAESRPDLVLLDARALYLDGPGVVERWSAASPDTRVVFVDADGPWTVLMELPDPSSGDIAITPCLTEDIAPAVEELIHSLRTVS
jgi:DNA-binding response OmpR family regulator